VPDLSTTRIKSGGGVTHTASNAVAVLLTPRNMRLGCFTTALSVCGTQTIHKNMRRNKTHSKMYSVSFTRGISAHSGRERVSSGMF